MLVQDIMTTHPACLKEDASIQEALDTFKGKHYDHFPIVNEDGDLVGIVSKSDIYHKLVELLRETSGHNYNEILMRNTMVSDLMTPQPIFVEEDTVLSDAIGSLLGIGFHALPVCRNMKVVGIVTSRDLLQAVNRSNLM